MFLTEEYKKRLSELSGTLLENRIEKLRKEKYSEDIIDFAYRFAKLTTRDGSQEEDFLRNQYIPWAAQEAKRNLSIIDEKNKLDIIINWIKESGYPKISTRENFQSVFNKASDWLSKRNINPSSGERVEGGRTIKTYPNNFRWIRVTNTNWCMNIGEKYGWCFNTAEGAEEFVGLDKINSSNQGYILLSNKDKPLLAVQYSPAEEIINDVQAPFNKPAKPEVLRYGLDLFSELGKITDVHGHLDNFWKSLRKYPELKEEFLKIDGVSLKTSLKLEKKMPLTPTERSSIDIQTLLKYKIPLTDKELDSTSLELKLKYNLPLNDKEKNTLRTNKKSFISKLWRAIKLEDKKYENIFTPEDFDGYEDYIFDYNKGSIELRMDEDDFEEYFSGLDEDSLYYYNLVNAHDYYESADIDEVEYMHNYMSDKNVTLLKNIANILNLPGYDFEKEGNLSKFFKKYTNIKIEDDFLTDLSTGWEIHTMKAVNDEVEKEQTFKYDGSYLSLPFDEIYKFVAEHPEKYIKSFKDLKNAEINGNIDLESIYSDNSRTMDEETYNSFNIDVTERLEGFIDKVESGELDISKDISRAHNILNSLGFETFENINYHQEFIPGEVKAVQKNGKTIFIRDIDYENNKFEVTILDFGDVKSIPKDAKPKKVLKGKIPYDKLSDYLYQYELFEGMKLREFIREIISEDFRYEYDNKSFIPPYDVIQTVKKALAAVNTNKIVDSSGSNEGSGTQKAKSLVSGEPINHSQLKRMKAFFDNNETEVKNELAKGGNINTSGIVQSWNLWGGDAGKTWTDRQISSVNSSNKTSKKIRNPEGGLRTKNLMNPNNTRTHR